MVIQTFDSLLLVEGTETKVGSVMPPRPDDRNLLSSGRSNVVCSQTMASSDSNGSAFKTPKRRERVFAKYVLRDGLVRVISTQKFYVKQMQWSVKCVTDYWRHLNRVRHGVYPDEVPMSLRFCISWITGHDYTDTSAREICGWLNRNMGPTMDGPDAATIMYLTWCHGGEHKVLATPRSQRPVCFKPMHVPIVDMPQPQFLHRATPPPLEASDEVSDSSDVALVDSDDAEPINGFAKDKKE